MRAVIHSSFKSLIVLSLWLLFSLGAEAGPWITGYYPQYEATTMPVAQIDFTTVTHVIHFSLGVNADGSLDTSDPGLTPSACATFTSTVHAAGRKALVCVGGAGSEDDFESGAAAGNLSKFVANLASFMSSNNYDGVDIDWEPLTDSDVESYTNFVLALRSALNAVSSNALLTVAAPAYTEGAMYASVQSSFNQINIMTYDLSGPWDGWVTWFNSPVFDGGYRFTSTGALVPSISGAVSNMEFYGVAPGKLGIGLPFYGYIWTGGSGVDQPRESWNATNVPTITAETYETITNSYYKTNLYHWDSSAQAAYLSVTNSPASQDMFISYDDASACQTKVSFMRNEGLGGIMIWELSQDYKAGAPAGQRAPLLTALNQALATPQILSAGLQNGRLAFTFSTAPLAYYDVLWTSNLSSGVWNILTNDVAGTGAAEQITDPGSPGAGARFYRVKTPP